MAVDALQYINDEELIGEYNKISDKMMENLDYELSLKGEYL